MASHVSVSFVTCVYNQTPAFFAECATSVSAQQISVEWIVVDDGSSPESAALHQATVEAVGAPVLTRFIKLPSNVGLSVARNAGIAVATGDWVVVLDSDDRAGVGLAKKLTRLPSSTAVACFEVNYFDEAESEHRRLDYFEGLFRNFSATSLDPFLWFDFYYHGIMVRRELLQRIGGYNPILKVGEDQDILLRVLEEVSPDTVAFVHEIGYEYRSNSNGVCRKMWKEVLAGYIVTMLNGAKRRGAPFDCCRFAEAKTIEGAEIDCYEYRTMSGKWVSWDAWHRNQKGSGD